MPTDVELRLIANNQNAVKGVRGLTAETEKLSKAEEKQNTKRKGFIETEEMRLKRLKEMRDKTNNINNLRYYSREIEKVTQNIQKLEKTGLEANQAAEKGNKNLIASLGKLALAYISVRTVIAALKETALAFFTRSQEGIELLERKVAGFKASLGVLQGEFIKLGKAMAGEEGDKSIPWGTRIVKGLKIISTTANLIPGVTKYFDDLAKRMNDAGDAAERYTLLQQELEDAERNLIVPRAEANLKIKEARLLYADESKPLSERIGYLEKALKFENEQADKEIAHQQWRILQIRAVNLEKEKTGRLTDEDRRILQVAIAEEINLREESYSRQFRATNSLKAAKRELLDIEKERLKTLKDEFAWGMELGAETFSPEELIKRMNAMPDVPAHMKLRFNKEILELNKRLSAEGLKIGKEADLADEEEKKRHWEAVKESLTAVTSTMTEIFDKQFEDAQRYREILDQRVSETQAALETEVELYKAGYASNVAAKEKELTDVKALRDQALKDEERARNRQLAMNKIAQTSNIISSASNILKNTTQWGPIGIAIAAAAIGAMFALLSSVKSRSMKLAKGGHGEVKGRLHSEGGEPFLDQIEVEQGERWGVLSRPASRRYGKIFGKMIDSFNRNELVLPKSDGVTNNILLDTSMTNSRLERVESQLVKLNRYFEGQEQLTDNGRMVIIKKGSTIRKIRR